MKRTLVFLSFLFLFLTGFAQGTITGKVIDASTREALPYVNLVVVGTQIGATTDDNGNFTINKAPFGFVKVQASYVGYQTSLSDDYLVTAEKVPYILIELKENTATLDEIVIRKKLFKKKVQSPLSLQSLGLAEIEKNPGGNRDVIRVIQSLPGVATNPGFRNDIIIRGGAPSENKFYLDGIEVPVINHFQTQGATGGPVGIINTDLIRSVDFYSSAFPSNRGNTLSSLIEFTQKKGNPNRLQVRSTLGTSDAGITLDGPLGEKTTVMASVRQSYLQLLFEVLNLPFLPTYTDFQVNINSQLSSRSELSLIALGAIDNFVLNEDVNDDVTDEETLKTNRYLLANIPEQDQWNYTVGLNYKYYGTNATHQFVLSRNAWNNSSIKFFNNSGQANDLLLDYESRETETKFRYENDSKSEGYTFNFGMGLEQASYFNRTFRRVANASGTFTDTYQTDLDIFRYALFGQVSKSFLNEKLGVSIGMRFDGNNFNDTMQNLFKQFSPRININYALNNSWSWNTSLGLYNQLPAYTMLGFRDGNGDLVNRDNLKFIEASHYVSGLEYRPNETTKVSLEGFYKGYSNYPFSVRDQISLANVGSDFGVVGNEEVTSTSDGRAYGFEFLWQKKSYSGIYGILSYTFVMSEFQDANRNFIPSTWDNRHLLTFTGGKKLKRNWEIGLRYRLVGGRPFTPYDLDASTLIANYDVANQGILDFTRLNTLRFNTFSQLDVRIDKTWYWKKFAFNLYLDIQNVLNNEALGQPFLTQVTDANGNPVVNAMDPTRYVLEEINNSDGTILPRFGFIVDF